MSTLSFEDSLISNRVSTRTRCGGGIRDRGFSKASRRNLRRRLASINRTAFRAFGGRVLFVTLTYPHVWPEDPEECKRHLKAFANGGCTWAFYDRSKNRSGRWCSMAVCGNRKKTRAYRRRTDAQGS